MTALPKKASFLLTIVFLLQGAVVGQVESSYQMQHFGDIVLRGLRVERGGEMRRMRDVMGTLRDWDITSSLVDEGMSNSDARKLWGEIKAMPGMTIIPVYSPQTVYWVKFDNDDTRMVVEDTELKTIRVVRPQVGRKLPLQGFWIERRTSGVDGADGTDGDGRGRQE